MISVPIDRIVPLTDARDNFSRLISDIETLSDGLYVLTKGGKPAIALINIKYLEEIMTSGPAANHQARITNHESDHKPEVSHKVHEPIHRPAPVKLPEPPKPPIIPKPNFEVPRITTAPISPSIPLPSTPSTPLGVNGDNTPKVAPPLSNYDVKPTVNPTWTGEEATAKPLAPSPSTALPSTQLGVNGVNSQQLQDAVEERAPATSANIGSQADSRQPMSSLRDSLPASLEVADSPAPALPPIAQFDKPYAPPPPSTPSKPTINPWPIIPPRRAETSSNQDSPMIPPRAPSEQGMRDNSSTVPPRPVNTALPLAPSSLAPSPSSFTTVPKPEASSPPPVASLPDASYPKMVAPPPPPPPSSLPRIPSSFQTVPVPINGNKGPDQPSAISSQPPAIIGSPADSRQPTADSPMPSPPLPPPPITTAPAPFANTSPTPVITPSTPLGINPKPADGIAFDQPPTTIPEPGEDLPVPSAIKTETPALVSTPTVTPAPADATPPQGQASVQDLEI